MPEHDGNSIFALFWNTRMRRPAAALLPVFLQLFSFLKLLLALVQLSLHLMSIVCSQSICSVVITLGEMQTRQQFQKTVYKLVISGNITFHLARRSWLSCFSSLIRCIIGQPVEK